MPSADIDIMPVPRPCRACGRPTTQFNRRLGVADCGRDDREMAPARRGVIEALGPPLRGRAQWWRRPVRHRAGSAV